MSFTRVILFGFAMAISLESYSNDITLRAQDLGQQFKTTVWSELKVNRKTGGGSAQINYRSENLNICYASGGVSSIEVLAVFTLGEGASARSYTYKMSPICPWHGGYPGYPSARFTFDSKYGAPDWSGKSDPYVWDKLFPADSKGKRWFALRVAFRVTQQGAGPWDSKSGADYRLIFK